MASKSQAWVMDSLWSQIFIHCVENEDNARPSFVRAPLLLCLVCRRWRRLANLTGRLWVKIDIQLGTEARFPVEALRAWMDRSEPRPLDLAIKYMGDMPNIIEVGEKIVPYCWRWEKLTLEIPTTDVEVLLDAIEIQPDSWVSLKSLKLKFLFQFRSTKFYLDLRSATQISSLEIRGRTVLDFGGVSLEMFPRLQSVTVFSLIPEEDTAQESNAIITLSEVTTLHLDSTCDASYIFNRLHLPSLTVLKLSVAAVQDCWPQFGGFLRRSNPPLESLNVYGLTEADVIVSSSLEKWFRGVSILATPKLSTTEHWTTLFPRYRQIKDDGCIVPVDKAARRYVGLEQLTRVWRKLTPRC